MRMSLYKLVYSLKIIQINVNYEEGNVNGRKISTAITANNNYNCETSEGDGRKCCVSKSGYA